MSNLCDLYLPEAAVSTEFRFVRVYDKSFIYEENKSYVGYLNIAVERILLLTLIVELRKKGITANSVPIRYHQAELTKQQAFELICVYAKENDLKVGENSFHISNAIPMFWAFPFTDTAEDIAGGILRVDRLDHHLWSGIEYLEYMHDYNHILFE